MPEYARDTREGFSGHTATKRARALIDALLVTATLTAGKAARGICAAARLSCERDVASAGIEVIAKAGTLVGTEVLPDVTGADADQALAVKTEFPGAAGSVTASAMQRIGGEIKALLAAFLLAILTCFLFLLPFPSIGLVGRKTGKV